MLSLLAIAVGFVLLLWSADRFIEGTASAARHLGAQPLLIGIIVVGFGTSTPEMVVSAMAALDGNPDLALGNAYGSNIANIGLILGSAAIVAPLLVHSSIIRKELPILLVISGLSGVLLLDDALPRLDGVILLAAFLGLVGWSVATALHGRSDMLEKEVERELIAHAMSFRRALIWLAVGLVLLVVSSRILVWGAVTLAESLGVSDLIIGLTIVALGTSLPELATSLIAARKGEHDIATGNIVGSNMFNLLAVIGIAAVIEPVQSVPRDILIRDWPIMMAMTVLLFLFAFGFRREGRINRYEGAVLLLAYVGYNAYLVIRTVGA
jgi:cation:H+ antiporter